MRPMGAAVSAKPTHVGGSHYAPTVGGGLPPTAGHSTVGTAKRPYMCRRVRFANCSGLDFREHPFSNIL